jgi:precorrin-6Y C5,15-methyltransferase (decarboxylating)
MSKWLTIIGMGEKGYEGLSKEARHALADADAIVGAERLLGATPKTHAEIEEWPQPFSKVVERISALKGRKTVLLATGDPSNYGVARKILTFVPFDEVTIIPHLSAFSLAAARLGWSLPDCDTLTLHGRHAAHLEPFIQPFARLIMLTADGSTVAGICHRLVARGFGESQVTVLENMGGPAEKITRFAAAKQPDRSFSALNTVAVTCIPGKSAKILPRTPGLPDDAFHHDGQLTKRDVRAATISALAPAPGERLWDVGAGCGSVAIEWMRSTRGAEAIAFEDNADRLKMIAANAETLGVPRLEIVAGRAPASFQGQPRPHAVFIGGGIGETDLFETAWDALKPGGRLVANVISLDGEAHVLDLQARHGGDLARIDVATLTHVGRMRALKPRMPVLQWRLLKPW